MPKPKPFMLNVPLAGPEFQAFLANKKMGEIVAGQMTNAAAARWMILELARLIKLKGGR